MVLLTVASELFSGNEKKNKDECYPFECSVGKQAILKIGPLIGHKCISLNLVI
jgi:predicted nucleotide-binding protein (sugar kinase/HSP70/actin superfamily)